MGRREFRISTTRSNSARNIKIALRRGGNCAHRRANELDLDGTIKGTAHKGLSRHPDAAGAAQRPSCCSSTSAAPWTGTSGHRGAVSPPHEFKHMSTSTSTIACERWGQSGGLTTPRRLQDVLHTIPTTRRSSSATPPMSPYEIMAPSGSVETTTRRPAQRIERGAHVSRLRLAQSRAGSRMEPHPIDPDDAPAPGRPDVSLDARRPRPSDAGVGPVARAPSVGSRFSSLHRERVIAARRLCALYAC